MSQAGWHMAATAQLLTAAAAAGASRRGGACWPAWLAVMYTYTRRAAAAAAAVTIAAPTAVLRCNSRGNITGQLQVLLCLLSVSLYVLSHIDVHACCGCALQNYSNKDDETGGCVLLSMWLLSWGVGACGDNMWCRHVLCLAGKARAACNNRLPVKAAHRHRRNMMNLRHAWQCIRYRHFASPSWWCVVSNSNYMCACMVSCVSLTSTCVAVCVLVAACSQQWPRGAAVAFWHAQV